MGFSGNEISFENKKEETRPPKFKIKKNFKVKISFIDEIIDKRRQVKVKKEEEKEPIKESDFIDYCDFINIFTNLVKETKSKEEELLEKIPTVQQQRHEMIYSFTDVIRLCFNIKNYDYDKASKNIQEKVYYHQNPTIKIPEVPLKNTKEDNEFLKGELERIQNVNLEIKNRRNLNYKRNYL